MRTIFYALTQDTGRPRWHFAMGGPIRCSAALTGSQVLFASDDMHAYSLDAASGRQKWKSEKLYGQSFRDYYPVVLGDKAVFRSVLVEERNDDLNGGTAFLQQRAGISGGWNVTHAPADGNPGRAMPVLIWYSDGTWSLDSV